jgi:hypothetical protein
MPADGPIDLRKLAEEAAAEAYSPRAKRCWFLHRQWSMWQEKPHPSYPSIYILQTRKCLACGQTQSKKKWIA